MAGVAGRSGGQQAKTPAQHRIEGTYQPVRHGGYEGPDPPKGAPPKPAGLNADASAEWDAMIGRFDVMGMLRTVDGPVLARYCQLHAVIERLSRTLDALPTLLYEKVSVDGAGVEHTEPKVHPVVNQLRSAIVASRPFLVEFGLTPASRGRVRLPTKADAVDPFAQFEKPVH
jgi:P27 family predicted phage terminase small subunit